MYSKTLFILTLSTAVESFSPSLRSLTHKNGSTTSGLSMSSAGDLAGKIAAQRFLYRFSDLKSPIKSKYTLEERQYFKVCEDRTLEPLDERCFILRDCENLNDGIEPPEESLKKNGLPRMYTKIGQAMHLLKDLEEADEEDDLGGTVWESSYVMALYCMENPDIISGKGLEVGSGVGVGGILGAIGAGVALGETEKEASKGYQSIEDIANSPAEDDSSDETTLFAPVPKNLSKICMSDSHDSLLNKCVDNLSKAKFPVSKAEVFPIDWKRRVPNEIKNQYDFIIGCDCAYYFPLVNPLARTVAYCLKNSPYDSNDNSKKGGRFVHIGPSHRESIDDLKRKLSRGYRMDTRMKDIVLERVDLVPLFLDSLDDEENQLEQEIVEGGFVEYQNIDTSKYTVLVGNHNVDYDGFNGEFFFPAETGREGGYGSQEVDYGTETSW